MAAARRATSVWRVRGAALAVMAGVWAQWACAGAWQRMPPPGKGLIRDMVVDKTGTLWVWESRGAHWWDGEAWHRIAEPAAPSGRASTGGRWSEKFIGGGDRDVYLTRRGTRDHEGELYRLSGHKLVYAGTYYYDKHYVHAGLYVGRAGDLFNYTGRFVAVRRNEGWVTAEAAFGRSLREVLVLDRSPGGPVLFFSLKAGVACGWDGRAFALAGLPPGFPPAGRREARAVPWGRDRVLFVLVPGFVEPGLFAAQVGEQAGRVDVAPIVEQIGPKAALLHDAWSAPDGSVWLATTPIRRRLRTSGGQLYHISVEGKVSGPVLVDALGRHLAPPWHRNPLAVARTRDGATWFALNRGGILRMSGGRQEYFDWRTGYVSHVTRHIVSTPGGELFAAGDYAVHHWAEEAAPDTSLTREWEQVVAVNDAVVRDPTGAMWVFRADRPGKVSRWDGESWADLGLGEPAGEHPGHILVDDRGRMILERRRDQTAWLIGPEGPRKLGWPHEAIAEAVATGARRFVTYRKSDKRITGPVVTGDGGIWFHNRTDAKIHFFARGQWQSASHPTVRAIGVGERDEPLFLDDRSVWTYRAGRLVDLHEAHPPVPSLKLATTGGSYPRPRFPYYKALPASSLREQTIFAADPKRDPRWYPVSWRVARQIEAGWPAEPPEDPNCPQGGILTRADPDGFWLANRHRWAGGEFLQDLVPTSAPFVKWRWKPIGLDAAGRVWVNNGGTGGGHEIFFQKTSRPAVAVRDLRVVRGRRVVFGWSGDEHTIGMVFRASSDADWKLSRPGRTATWDETHPGKRTLRLEARGVGSIGGLGVATALPVEVDVRVPKTRWTSDKRPAELSDILWRPPVAATWAFEDQPHRIEYTVGGGPWQALGEGDHIPLVEHNGKAVRIALRAIEEDAFPDPEPLTVDLRVRIDVAAAVHRRIRLILSGREEPARQAATELRLVQHQAIQALSTRISGIRRNLATATAAGRAELQPILDQLQRALAIVQGT